MLTHGLDKFKEYFAGFENQYVIIGGTACSLLFDDAGVDFRSTKDIDMVLIVESLTKEFAEKFFQFVYTAGYEHQNKSTGLPQFYRFSKPKNNEFPSMIELFSRNESDVILKKQNGLMPLHIDDEVSSLSAILLNESYYKVLKSSLKVVDGVSVLKEEALLVFKIKAWLDLSIRKQEGENIDSNDIKKHKNDIFRLSGIILNPKPMDLPEEVKYDIEQFFEKILSTDIDLKNLHIRDTKDNIIQKYKTIFKMA
ncbi:MAG: hypothetical protein K5873_06175 [Treponema sp.]|nr:hypothetical protein [Treponema sp.]